MAGGGGSLDPDPPPDMLLFLKAFIEVDGGYYHLNAAQYRRDRRKDHAYQRHGYWVLRFLAEDIVEDSESILATILDAVALRRGPSTPR